jgi:hypothetical protein
MWIRRYIFRRGNVGKHAGADEENPRDGSLGQQGARLALCLCQNRVHARARLSTRRLDLVEPLRKLVGWDESLLQMMVGLGHCSAQVWRLWLERKASHSVEGLVI